MGDLPADSADDLDELAAPVEIPDIVCGRCGYVIRGPLVVPHWNGVRPGDHAETPDA